MSDWKKSSYSGSQAECVEVKMTSDEVYVRDTKNRDGEVQRLSRPQWDAFIRSIKASASGRE